MITKVVDSEINTLTWYEFHDSRNENSMNNITERVILFYDAYDKVNPFQLLLFNLYGGLKELVEKEVQKCYS